MTTTPTITRRTEATCPAWCSGHLDEWQGWETLTDGTGQVREHSSPVATFGTVEIATGQTEHAVNGFSAPDVEVYVNGDGRLTDAQAHELGMALVRAADVLRRARMEAGR